MASFLPPDPVEALEAFLADPSDPALLDRAMWLMLARQGLVPLEVAQSLRLAEEPVRGGLQPPPGLVYRDMALACDLTGDGVRDVLSNDLTLQRAAWWRPPTHKYVASTIVALDGATGEELWAVDNLYHIPMASYPGFTVNPERLGVASPNPRNDARLAPDLDGDGVCDVLAMGAEFDGGSSLLVVSRSFFRTTLRALSGATGATLWEETVQGEVRSENALTALSVQITNFPTGVEAHPAGSGHKLVSKFTDFSWSIVYDRTGVTGQTGLFRQGTFNQQETRVVDRVELRDAAKGEVLWARAIGEADESPAYTNYTWINGVSDLDGDDEPEVLLDHYLVTNPRSADLNNPASGEVAKRAGRGMAYTALSGKPDGAGESLWV
ncbi:MAG TPA: hypothetical protein VHH36_03170, partial [Candidatus Thermoplasmatota archaeon]|nr:hypothetical protein [Candidatus Thermoplasmatota archaeon]